MSCALAGRARRAATCLRRGVVYSGKAPLGPALEPGRPGERRAVSSARSYPVSCLRADLPNVDDVLRILLHVRLRADSLEQNYRILFVMKLEFTCLRSGVQA
ncbi:unnamed protein product [Spodoptera littoralis]|uniref:Uncharacterized protein n=1 Tax=Spodoptera littoralis TaxID=7109 RepID=A0A9P0IB61_SPOLI|nr:unnamed protein product [Spodoptera littoralis]CAH1642074.1 unnamed protein product [Spodoptera littoralis]